MFLCLARVVTPRLTRAIVPVSSVQAVRRPGLHGLRVGIRQHAGATVLADIFAVVADEAVALAGHAVLDLAGRGELEALLHAALGLELGHFRPFYSGEVKTAAAALVAGPFVMILAREAAPLAAAPGKCNQAAQPASTLADAGRS